MTQIPINGSESGMIRLFHLDLPREAIERFTVQAGTGEWPLKYGLGAEKLRAAFVEIVDLGDLGEMPLTTYLKEGYGADPAALRPHSDRVNKLRGHVLVLPSAAFDQHSQTLNIAPPLTFIGAFPETASTPAMAPLRSSSASGVLTDVLTGTTQMSRGPKLPPMLLMALLGVGVFVLLLLAMLLRG
ncbi:MAG: aspartate carbamoyltransferase catalytic subunit [Pelagimonas sp.]|jgi:hypothetical protein|nr:aspartate carbamoyltransferase catalytic subunit [Pelagimonas sp.]